MIFRTGCSTVRGGRAWLIIAVCSAWTAAAQTTPPSSSTFEFQLGYTTFDGVTQQTVILKSRELTLTTDTLGTWVPLERPIGNAGFSLRNQHDGQVTASISVLSSEWAAGTDEVWKRLVALLRECLGGESTAVSGQTDSNNGPPAIRLFGWRTREVEFTPPSVGGAPALVHHYVFSSDGKRSVLFVLSGDASSFASRRDNFWFFVSRLTVE